MLLRVKSSLMNPHGNEAHRFRIVAFIIVIIGVVVLKLFRTEISGIAYRGQAVKLNKNRGNKKHNYKPKKKQKMSLSL